jgi:hypothetical protein
MSQSALSMSKRLLWPSTSSGHVLEEIAPARSSCRVSPHKATNMVERPVIAVFCGLVRRNLWWRAMVSTRSCDRGSEEWHNRGMARARLSTTVDEELLSNARALRSGMTDAALIDEALEALLSRHRAAEVDATYAAYDKHPIDEPDEWGDLASFRRAAAAS